MEVFILVADRKTYYRIYSKKFASLEALLEAFGTTMISLHGMYILHCLENDLARTELFKPIKLYMIDFFGAHHEVIEIPELRTTNPEPSN